MNTLTRVSPTARGEEALRLFRDFTGCVDLLTTDVVMPGMGGQRLTDQLRVLSPDTYLLFISSCPATLTT